MTTLIDTNIIVAIWNANEDLHQWATDQFALCKTRGPALISDMIYCELAGGVSRKSDLDRALQVFALERLPSTDDALFRASVAFSDYRSRAKENGKKNVLPDFFIGAIAETYEIPILTSDTRRYRTYFPNVSLIAP
jgi:predicted nucleic acid-binding protein